MHDLLRRQAALEKTLRKYRGRAIDWREVDCVRMLRSHLVAMGARGLPRLPRYSTPVGALRALRGAGFESLEALLDATAARIAPAAALDGDVVLGAGDVHFQAVGLHVAHKIWGWHQDNGCSEPIAIVVTGPLIGAWRA